MAKRAARFRASFDEGGCRTTSKLDFCTLYVQEDGGFQEFLEFSSLATGAGQYGNLSAEALFAQRRQHIGERRRGY